MIPTDDNLSPEWRERMAAAQLDTHTLIGARRVARRPYGGEHEHQGARCRDCAVKVGELHVKGCVVERCPSCGGQAIICDCHARAETRNCVARRFRGQR